ncbi:MAG: nuclear transport factor 2 family protein [Solirubrobacteraceae bacterium]
MSQPVAASPDAGTVVRKLLEALETLDVESLRAVLHPDVEVTEPASLPYGGTYSGRDAFFNELFPALVTKFDIAMEDPEVFEAAGSAATRMKVVYTSKRTGRALRMPYVEVYGIQDDLIRWIDVYPQDAARLTEFMNAES